MSKKLIWWRTLVAVAVYGIAMSVCIALTGMPLVTPFAFIVTFIAAWDLGLLASLGWIGFVHVAVPIALLLAEMGPFALFPEVRGIVAILLVGSTIADLVLANLARRLRAASDELRTALEEVKELRGFLPICAWCKDVRDISGNWERIESYVTRHSRAQFTHALCPKCLSEKFGVVSDK